MGLFDFFKSKSKSIISRKYVLNNTQIIVPIETVETHPGQVKISIFREKISNGIQNVNPIQFTTESNFFNDISILIKGMDGKPFGNEAICESLIAYCKSELQEYGRLIDVDIEGYIDAVMHIIVAITKASNMTPLKEKEGIKLREAFKTLVYKKFFNDIYVNKYNGSPFPALVKLSELQH